MTRDRERFEDYPVLSEIKLSQNDREEILNSIEQGMKGTRIQKTKRGLTMIKTAAAAVAALALVGGGIGYEVHHTGMNPNTSVASHPQVSTSKVKTRAQSDLASEIALIKNKGYSVNGTTPNATVKTASGDTLTAWVAIATQSQDGYNQFVFFFLNGRYIGTDTAKPSVNITSAKAAGQGIAVTYPVYMKNDSFAHPTGTPVTITYTWNGSRLVPNKPYPKQFQGNSATTQGNNPISTTSYATATEAANHVLQIGAPFSLQGTKLNLGLGITASATGAMGSARYEWREGNWEIEIRFYTANQGVAQVAKNMVSYLHTHWMPAPNHHGMILVQSSAPNPSGYHWNSTIAWQEGTKVLQLKQSGNPVQALTSVVNQTGSGKVSPSNNGTSTNASSNNVSSHGSFSQTFKISGVSSQVFLTPTLGFRVTNLGGGLSNFQYDFSKTTDGGKSWTKMSKGHFSHVEGVSFINENTGYLLNNSPAYSVTPDLFVTHNGGATWNEQKLPIPNAYKNGYRNSNYPIFFSPQVGFIPVYGQATSKSVTTQFLYMLATTNGGASWTAYTGHQGDGLKWSVMGQKLTVTDAAQSITVNGLLAGNWTVSRK